MSREDGPAPTDSTVAHVLAVLWANLVDMLGTAAAASLLRRAIKRAVLRCPELAALEVVRDGWEYRCVHPDSWHDLRPADVPAFGYMLHADLYPILRELTGRIVVRRLTSVPELESVARPPLED